MASRFSASIARIALLLVLPTAIAGQQPAGPPASPAVVAPPTWTRVVKLPDGREFVTDGGFVIDAAIAKPATLPTVVIPPDSAGAKNIAGYFAATYEHEFGLNDLRAGSMSNIFVAPGGIGLNGNYISFLRGVLSPRSTRLRANGPRDPVVVIANGQPVAVLMPVVLPQ